MGKKLVSSNSDGMMDEPIRLSHIAFAVAPTT
jgi:hypothetical protein